MAGEETYKPPRQSRGPYRPSVRGPLPLTDYLGSSVSDLMVRVSAIVDPATDIRGIKFRAMSGSMLPSFEPGSHIDVHVAPGVIRQYSLCSSPDHLESYLIAVKLERPSRTADLSSMWARSPEEIIVEALLAHGVSVETSCEQGVCGACLTGVIEGQPDHRDVFLSDAERAAGDKIMVCVSRSRSPVLVLDL